MTHPAWTSNPGFAKVPYHIGVPSFIEIKAGPFPQFGGSTLGALAPPSPPASAQEASRCRDDTADDPEPDRRSFQQRSGRGSSLSPLFRGAEPVRRTLPPRLPVRVWILAGHTLRTPISRSRSVREGCHELADANGIQWQDPGMLIERGRDPASSRRRTTGPSAIRTDRIASRRASISTGVRSPAFRAPCAALRSHRISPSPSRSSRGSHSLHPRSGSPG